MTAVVIHPSRGARGGVMNASVAHAHGLAAAGVPTEFWTGSPEAAEMAGGLGVRTVQRDALAEPWAPLAASALRVAARRARPSAVIHQGARSWAWGRAFWPQATHAVVFHNYRVYDRRLFRNWLALSNAHAARLARERAWGVLRPRVAAVKNGDAQTAAKPAAPPRRAWRADGRLVIGVLGALEPRKGQDLAIAALAELRAAGVDAELRLGGLGGTKKALRAQAKALGLADHVAFLGWVDAVEFISTLDVFCLPSRAEPFGLVLIEALAQGAPCVAAAVDGPADILAGEAGVLVPPEDPAALAAALAALADDPTRAARLSRAATDRAETGYSPAAVGRSLIDAMNSFGAALAPRTDERRLIDG